MWNLCACSDSRAGRKRQACGPGDLSERERIELRHDLALEPGPVALARMLASPAAIAAVSVADRLATRKVHVGLAPWIVTCGSLGCEHFASCFDRSQALLAPGLRHARIAVAAPALEHRLAAQRARDRIGWARFYGRRAPCSRCVWSRLRGLTRRCEQRRSLWTWNAAALIPGFSRERARRCAFVDQRFTERLCEARRDRPQAFAPVRCHFHPQCNYYRSFRARGRPSRQVDVFPCWRRGLRCDIGNYPNVGADDYDVHIRVGLRILEYLDRHNSRTEDAMRRFSIRVGLNDNIDNVVTDINNNKNLAGSGINGVQRVMSAADANQMFVSRAVYDRLRDREAYMRAFREVASYIKHGERLTVYQVALDGQPGLDASLPKALQPAATPRLPRLLAYYMRFALDHQEEILSMPDVKGNSLWEHAACIMYFLMALDTEAREKAGPYEKPTLKLGPPGNVTFRERLAYYQSQDIWVKFELARQVQTMMLSGFEYCFDGARCVYVNDRGIESFARITRILSHNSFYCPSARRRAREAALGLEAWIGRVARIAVAHGSQRGA